MGRKDEKKSGQGDCAARTRLAAHGITVYSASTTYVLSFLPSSVSFRGPFSPRILDLQQRRQLDFASANSTVVGNE